MKKLFCSEKEICGIIFAILSDGEVINRIIINSALPSDENVIKTHSTKIQIIHKAIEQIEEYFALKRKEFDVPVFLEGTEFQKKVWKELLKVPYGSVISYEQLAVQIGNKHFVRAVGKAVGSNPIPIIIPCHRVIGKNGSLIGYSGGLEIKKMLLGIEGVLAQDFLQ